MGSADKLALKLGSHSAHMRLGVGLKVGVEKSNKKGPKTLNFIHTLVPSHSSCEFGYVYVCRDMCIKLIDFSLKNSVLAEQLGSPHLWLYATQPAHMCVVDFLALKH